MTYAVYKNRVHKYAAVHKETCSNVKVHGGVSSTTPPTGEWVDDIDTAELARREAEREAKSKGWEVKMCSNCNP